MNYISLFLIGFYFISIAERYFIGSIFYENVSDTSGIREFVFGNGFAYHLWSTKNKETECLYVTNTEIYLNLPVRHLYYVRYVNQFFI